MSEDVGQLIDHAKNLGFDFVGFTSPVLEDRYLSRYRDWVASGAHGGMDYLKRRVDTGIDVETLLPGTRSIIVLGVGYRQDAQPIDRSSGRVARYAVYRDYHRIIGKRLRRIEGFIRDKFGGEARGFVDSGPIQERAYAESSGLGYIGRSGMLITPEFGSWVFLACVLTTLELEATAPGCDLSCRDCGRCVAACPTGAIRGDGTVDARRCVSYLTIEHRGAVPEALRPLIGDRVFGCDTCQNVCPHNAAAQPVVDPEFIANRRLPDAVPLVQLLGCESDDAFVERFAGTPIMRAKRLRMLRNGCVVAGNSGNRELVDALQMLRDREKDEVLREHASWAIQRLSLTDGGVGTTLPVAGKNRTREHNQ